MPVPLRGIESVGFVALLVTVMVPLEVPVRVGVNDAVSVALVPAAIVNGVFTGVRENPLPEIETADTVTSPVPVFLTETFSDEVVLIVTFPKAKEDGVAVRGPGVAPVPLSGTERFGLEALLVTLKEPVTAPDALGANVTVSC